MKVSHNDAIDKYITVPCEHAKEIRAIMQSRIDFPHISDYNNFYFSENGENDDNPQFWVEANGDYTYLYYINGAYQYQSRNDGNGLDPNGVTTIIPYDPVSHSNSYCHDRNRDKCRGSVL